MNKFTPGPWGAILRKNACYMNNKWSNGWTVEGPKMVPDYERPMFNEEDANLIAAAPELYAALERALNRLDLLYRYQPVHDFCETIAEAQAALAKAKGEQP